MWSGVLGTIPANWNLCDGGGTTPNLVAKFLRGAPAATNPGTTGGNDNHTHASMTAAGAHVHTMGAYDHQHTVNLAGDHIHSMAILTSYDVGAIAIGQQATEGAHQHTTNLSATHVHTMDNPGTHTHTRTTVDGRPPYYEVAYIQAAVGALTAVGLIIIWSGALAAIPAGWDLCDGGASRPDLRTRFLRGINTGVTNPGTTGGNDTHIHVEGVAGTHSHTEVAAGTHTHTFNVYAWTHGAGHNVFGDGPTANAAAVDDNAGSHTHAVSDSIGSHTHNALGVDPNHAHTVNPADSKPAYYDVAYIYNTAASSIPANGILIWSGLLVNIPVGYDLCDGGGGRPELRSKFLRGASAGIEPGGTGGSDTHTHTDVNDSHTHTETSAGAHQHAATDTIGSHTHGTESNDGADFSGGLGLDGNTSNGNHSHTYNNEDDHTHTLVNHSHNHNPWSTDTVRPAYYEVAFILKS